MSIVFDELGNAVYSKGDIDNIKPISPIDIIKTSNMDCHCPNCGTIFIVADNVISCKSKDHKCPNCGYSIGEW